MVWADILTPILRRMVALKSAFVSPITHCRQTPLRQLIKRYPELAIKVFNRCISTNLMKGKEVGTRNCLSDKMTCSTNTTLKNLPR